MPDAYSHLQVDDLTPSLGAEVCGVDLAKLDAPAVAEIRRAFLDRLVLVFRDQTLTRDQHKAFGRLFGGLHQHPGKPDTQGPGRLRHPAARRPGVPGELTPSESESVLGLLYRHVEAQPRFHCRVRWTPNTLVFWDNRCAQHHAVWDYFPETRVAERVTIAGTAPSAD